MSDIGLIVAMSAELPDLFQYKSSIQQIGDNRINVAVSGIGQKRARYTTRKICRDFNGFYPEYLIALGFCGATHDELDIGQLIIADRLSYHDHEIELENQYLEKAISILEGSKYKAGKLQTFSWPVFSRKSVSEDTIAVDMESFAIARTARDHNIPLTIIKAVSDIVPQKSNLGSLLNFLKTMRSNSREAKKQLNIFARNYFLKEN